MIDTIGEYYYAYQTREKYLKAITAKLLPGGMASIYPAQCPIEPDYAGVAIEKSRAWDGDIDAEESPKAAEIRKWELHQRALNQDGIQWGVEFNKSTKEPGYVLTIKRTQ